MKLIRVGVDLSKQVFQAHGVDRHEQSVWRRKLSRTDWLKTLLKTIEPGCVVGMEACGGAHHWARQLQQHGYTVKLIAPQFVKPYVKSNKNDANDAEAICEAMSRPSMRFVSVKTVEQQDIQATHRIRAALVEQRTAKVNQTRPSLRVWLNRPKRSGPVASCNTMLARRLGEWIERPISSSAQRSLARSAGTRRAD